MLRFRNFVDFQIIRGIQAFLSLEGGLVRGELPRDKREREALRKSQEISRLKRELAGAKKQVSDLRARKDQRIYKLRGELTGKRKQVSDLRTRKNEEISQIRGELAEKRKQVSHLNRGRSRETGSPEKTVPIFFVVGVGKSGTTWLRRILDAHPEVLCRGEGKFFGRNIRRSNSGQPATNALGKQLRPASLYNALAENEHLRLWMEHTFWTRNGHVEKQMANLTHEAIRLFLVKRLSKTKKRVVGDKVLLQEPEMLEEINAICPEAKVVHIVRDGRDMAVSRMHHDWNRQLPVEEGGLLTPEELDKRDRYRQNPEGFRNSGESIFTEERIASLAKLWNSNVSVALQNGPVLLGEKYLEVRYEDLLENPEQVVTRIFRFLGVRSDEQIAGSCVEEASFEKRTGGRERGEEDSTSAVRKGIAGDWKNVFTERDKLIYWEIAGDMLTHLGYENNSDW